MNKIKSILHEQGRTQVFLSSKLQKSTNTISLWCRNVVQPSVPDLYRIAEILDISVSEILVEKNNIKSKK